VNMNPIEQQLENYFRLEAGKAIPSPSWWDRAVGRAVERKRTGWWYVFYGRTRLAWVMAPLAVLLIAGIAFASSSVIRERFMSMFPQVEHSGLAQELNLSQTIDGVTVKVERAYADANGVLVGYTVSGPPITATGPGVRYFSKVGKLTVVDGPVLPALFGSGTAPGSKDVLGDWGPSDRLAVVSVWDASQIEGAPSEINIKLPINVYDRVPIPEAGQATQQTFNFEFKINFHSGKTITPKQTVEAAGIPITLEEVVITPWATRVEFSFAPPYDTIDSRPILKTTISPPGSPVTESYEGRDKEGATWQYFYDNLTTQTGEWTITIDELNFPSVNTEWSEIETNGQKVLVGKGGEPEKITGPWIFKFNVP
jgi:hypothetical protein